MKNSLCRSVNVFDCLSVLSFSVWRWSASTSPSAIVSIRTSTIARPVRIGAMIGVVTGLCKNQEKESIDC